MLPKPEKSIRSKKILPSESGQLEFENLSPSAPKGGKKLVYLCLLASFILSTIFWLVSYFRSGVSLNFRLPSIFPQNLPSIGLLAPSQEKQLSQLVATNFSTGQWDIHLHSTSDNQNLVWKQGDIGTFSDSRVSQTENSLDTAPLIDATIWGLPQAVVVRSLSSVENSPYTRSVLLKSPVRTLYLHFSAINISETEFTRITDQSIPSLYWLLVGF